jgi:hypothetical protein
MKKASHQTEEYITRTALAARWDVHPETIKRDEKKGLLTPHYFGTRRVRYHMSEVHALEYSAASRGAMQEAPAQVPGRFRSRLSKTQKTGASSAALSILPSMAKK